MRVIIIDTKSDLLRIKNRWDDLLNEANCNFPYYSWTWYERWWEYFGNENELFIITVEDSNGKLAAIAPLMKRESTLRGFKISEICFMDNGIGPRNRIFFKNESHGLKAVNAIFEYFLSHSSNWDIINLESIDDEIPFLDEINDYILELGLFAINSVDKKSPFLEFNGDFKSFMGKKFGSKQRNTIKRKVRIFAEKGEAKVVQYNNPGEIQMALDIAFKVSRSSWKGKNGTDMSASQSSKSFYTDITNYFAKLNQVKIWILKLQDKPVAVQYQLFNNNKVYMLIIDFCEEYKKLSPGTVLMYHILQKYHDEDEVKEFDFCGDAHDYKLKWGNNVREHKSLQIFNRRPYSYFIYFAKAKVLPMFRKITHT